MSAHPPSLRAATAQDRKIRAGGVPGGRRLKDSTKRISHQHTGNSSFMESSPNIGKTTDGVPALSSLEYDVMSTPSKRAQKRKHMMEEDQPIEGGAGKKTSPSLEKSCVRRTLSVLLSHLKTEPENLEESDQKSSAGKSKARSKTPLQPTSTHCIPDISRKKVPVGSLQEDPSEEKCDVPPEMIRGNKRPVVELVRLREESENLEENVFEGKSNSENGTDQESGSGVSAPSTHSTATTNGVRRSVRNKKLQYDTLEEEKLFFKTDDAANLLANMKVNPKVVQQKPSTDESDSEEESDQEQMELSAYERERLKNIRENAKFLNSIKLLESAASLHPPKKKNQNCVVKREKPQNGGKTVVRRSMRLQNVAPSKVKLEEESPAVEENVRLVKPPGPIEMIPMIQQDDEKAMDQFMRMWTSISQESIKTPANKAVKDLKSYEKSLKKMKLRAEDVAKVVPSRILSLAIHPSERQTLLASGDKYGNVGLWNVNDNSDEKAIHMFDLHSRSVGRLSFCPWNPAHLLSLSYDGTMRCGDVTRSVFDEIYRDEEESFSSFGFYSADGSVLIVSHWDSTLSLMDRRTPGTTYEVRAPVDLSSPRSVSVHPLQRELCVVAGARDVCVYDIRQISNKKLRPVVSLPGHLKSVSSAYFSPVTGNRILTTCADDRLRVFDSSSPSSTVPLLTSIRHNNFTGRWLSRFQALWDPKQEDCFMVGSMSRPRQIEVYHEDGKLIDIFWDENLNSVCSINIMHPTRSILVGGNSSGRLHVFRDQSA